MIFQHHPLVTYLWHKLNVYNLKEIFSDYTLKMIDSKNTKIFFVQSENNFIFGATTMTLPRRKASYKVAYEQGKIKKRSVKTMLI